MNNETIDNGGLKLDDATIGSQLPNILQKAILFVKKEPDTFENKTLLTKLQEATMWWFQGHSQTPA